MATSYGWTGKILRVDLTTGEMTETLTSDYAQFIGGRGIAAMIYWETVPPECGAFDPENALIFMTGPGTGTLAPTASKFCVASKSPAPVKEIYSWSEPSGHWSAELKFAGYDGLVVTGKSPKPVYLWINDGKAELRSAERLWGMWLSNMMLEIQNLHGPQARVAGIGPAGENLCRQAPIIVDREHATGITGAGAVMGSKNLKAIAVRGTGAVNVAEPQELIDLWYYYRRLLTRTPAEMEAEGTWPHTTRSLSYYMWHGSHQPYVKDHPPEPKGEEYFTNYGMDSPYSLMREAVDAGTVKIKFGGCYACPVCCAVAYQSTDVDIPSGSGQCNDMETMPQYEWAATGGTHLGYPRTTGTAGKLVGVPNIWFNRYMDDLGLSFTETLGYHYYWFLELVDQGYITEDDCEGLKLDEPWTPESIRGLAELVAYRRGIGDLLAEGEARFLASFAEKYPATKAIHEGVTFAGPYYIPWAGLPNIPDKHPKAHGFSSGAVSMLRHAVGVRSDVNKNSASGGKSFTDRVNLLPAEEQKRVQRVFNLKYFGVEDATEGKNWDNKVPVTIWCEDMSMNMDCITYCGWAGAYSNLSNFTPPDYQGDPAIGAKVFSAVTGISMDFDEMLAAMKPLWNIERSIHVREGRRREHDMLADWVFESPLALDWTSKEEFSEVLDEYYTARGWDPESAIPRRSTLEEQGLKKIADELESKYGVTVPA